MKAVVSTPSACLRTIAIELDLESVETAFNAKLATARKKVQLPGFRVGKVPVAMIKAQFGQSLKAEAIDEAMNTAFRSVCEENKITPVSDPTISDLSAEEGQPVKFTISVDVDADISVSGYKDLGVRSEARVVGSEEIDKVIEDMCERLAGLKDTGKPSRSGDSVTIEYSSVKIDGLVRELSAPSAPIELGKSAISSFNTGLIGMSAGETAKFSETFVADFQNAEFAGHTVDFEVKVLTVGTKDLPAVDAEFAKKVGDFDTVDALKDAIRKDIEERAKAEAREAAWEKAIDALITKNDFEIPASRIEYFITKMSEDEAKYYPQGQLPSREALTERYRETAIRSIKRHRLVDWIAEKEGVKASAAEVDERITAIAEYYQRPFDEIKDTLRRNGRTLQIREELKEQKVLNCLIGEAAWA